MPPRKGLFITFEGIEGCGKTTQIRRLGRDLRRAGVPVILTREPGGTLLGDTLRRLLLDPATAGLPPLAELLLYAAARADHVQRIILPALERGRVVLCDRYLDATLAYQGYGRGVPLALIRSIHGVEPLRLRPDLTVLLHLPVEEGLARARGRNDRRSSREGRFEEESLSFHERVAAGYEKLARSDPHRYRIVDASGPIADIAARVTRAVFPRAVRFRTSTRRASSRRRARARRR